MARILITNIIISIRKNIGKYKKFEIYFNIIINEKDINPSYDGDNKTNTQVIKYERQILLIWLKLVQLLFNI